jgi:formate hydrogenlyase maturation protein HycH
MTGNVVFYRLGRRFLDAQQRPPADAQQVVYYSLAIGHHVGVIDALSPILTVPYDRFLVGVEALGPGEAKRKLDGVRRFGEITIDAEHVALLRSALQAAFPALDREGAEWARALDLVLQEMEHEPALYLMVRRR